MEQNSSTKVVSLHAERCREGCPHRLVCYHKLKNIVCQSDFYISITERLQILMKNWTIYESVCEEVNDLHWHLLKFYNNYNITISCQLYKPYLDTRVNQIQISVYNLADIIAYEEYQKLYLIKDEDSWNFFISHFKDKRVKKTHFLADQSYISKEQVKVLCNFALNNDTSNTIDSCLMSYLLNGRCPFSYYNYVDITFDGTARSCPYAKEGVELSSDYIFNDDTFRVNTPPNRCIYKELFGGDADVRND